MMTEIVNPEALYLSYRKKRSLRSLDSTEQRVESAQASNKAQQSIAGQVYQSYQQCRVIDRDEAIDKIMGRIKTEAVALSIEQSLVESNSDIQREADASRNEQPNKARNNYTVKYFGFIFSSLKGLLGNSVFRVAMPALAVGLLSLFIVPTFFADKESYRTLLAESVTTNAGVLGQYIDINQAQTLGFSSGHEPARGAFNRGMISTNIMLAAQSGNTVFLDQLRQELNLLTNSDEQHAFDTVVRAVAAEQLVTAGESETVQLAVQQSLTVFLGLMQSNADHSGKLQWFEHGQALQAVFLTARFQLASDQQQPLIDSMAVFSQLAMVDSDLPAKKLISRLKTLIKPNDPESIDVRSILETSGDIKLLMR